MQCSTLTLPYPFSPPHPYHPTTPTHPYFFYHNYPVLQLPSYFGVALARTTVAGVPRKSETCMIQMYPP